MKEKFNKNLIYPIVFAVAAVLTQVYGITVDEEAINAWVTVILSIGGFVGIFMNAKK